MDTIKAIERIKNKFKDSEKPVQIPLLKGGTFTAQMVDNGVEVDNLGAQPFIHWSAFSEAICVLIRNGGSAAKGNAMNCRLGGPNLPLDSIEGHIARVVYGKQVGESVFRRITPISCILIWAGLCKSEPNRLVLM